MSDFTVDFVSPAENEYLAAEISYKGQIFCLIDKEDGDRQLSVEFFHEARLLEKKITMKFHVSDFLVIFNETCKDLEEIPDHRTVE